MNRISIITPVYNESGNIASFTNEVEKNCPDVSELIFIDDGSTDNTFGVIQSLAPAKKFIKCISLSRNFGHQNALMAGLENAEGDIIIIMDGDLQHPPEMIPSLLLKLNEGYDIVHTTRSSTAGSGMLKRAFTHIFYKFLNSISDTKIEANQPDFKIFTRKVLNTILQFKERELFLRGIFSWIGFKNTSLEFAAPARQSGTTKYSFGKMLKLAVKGTTSFSFKPLRLALLIGTLISILAFSFAVYALVSYYNGNTVPGWASVIIAIMFLGGTQLLAIGLLGEYIAGLFTESKKRPLYIIDKKINL